jgi:hypothetical protein
MIATQGWRSWNAWNVSLWINNDEALYRMAQEAFRANNGKAHKAARCMLRGLQDIGVTRTPDGGRYNVSAIAGAMADYE